MPLKYSKVFSFPLIIVDFESNYDATVVSKLKSHGAIIVGKTNLDEFGMGSYNLNTSFGSCVDNRCLNSQGFGKVVGGSSGGSAASVLFGTVLLQLEQILVFSP